MTSAINIRPARPKDMAVFYPEGLRHTTYALAIEVDGKLRALAGFVITRMSITAFSDHLDISDISPVTRVRVAKRALRELAAIRSPIYAISRHKENNSKRLLTLLGFTHLRDNQSGGVFYYG